MELTRKSGSNWKLGSDMKVRLKQGVHETILPQDCCNPTPVFSCILYCEVLQGHSEGEIPRVVYDRYSATFHLLLKSCGLHNLIQKWQAWLSAPKFVKSLEFLFVVIL